MIDRAEAFKKKALQYERAANMATDPDACRAYLELARQLRAMAELADALKQAANLRRGIW
jgi:hypothetical protein